MAITEAQDATEVSSPDLSATREEIRRYERSPVDVIRLLVFTAITLGLGALAKWSEHSVLGFERDVVVLFDFLNAPVARVVSGAMQVFVGVLIVAYFVVPIVTRRYRLFGYLIVANIVAGGLASLFVWSVDRTKPAVLVNAIARRAGLSAHFPTEWAMAVLVAAFIVLAPFVGRRWRRAGWVSICVILLCRLIVSVHLPVDLLACMSLGAAVGTAVLLAFGRPDRHPTTAAVESALRNGGTPITELAPAAVDARGSAPYFGRLEDGTRIFYEVYGTGERTIVFVPPWAIVHSRLWKGQIPYLARHFRVVTFEQPPKSTDDMIGEADRLMYTVKRGSKNNLIVGVWPHPPDSSTT